MDASMYAVQPAAPPPPSMNGAAQSGTAVASPGRSVPGKPGSDPVLLLVALVGVAVACGWVSVSGALRVGKGKG